jgi:hypothetical protein
MLDAAVPLSLDINRHISDIMGIVSIVAGAAWLLWAWYLLVREGHGYLTELFRMEISPVTDRLVTSGPLPRLRLFAFVRRAGLAKTVWTGL